MIATTLAIIGSQVEEVKDTFFVKVDSESYDSLTDAQKVFVSMKEMDVKISEYYGRVAHDLVNKDRETEGKPRF